MVMWEQEPDDLGESPAILHVVARTGEYLERIELEESWVDFAVREGHIYALVRHPDTGIVGLAAYNLHGAYTRASEVM